jgi:hypothetical protein
MAEFLKKTNDAVLRRYIYVSGYENSNSFVDTGSLSTQRLQAISWLAKNEVTSGCNPAGPKYCPSKTVNRGSMAEFLFRMSGSAATYKDYSPNFKDIKHLASERIRAINWMKDSGISKGSGNANTYRPVDPVTRGAMAQFLHRYYNFLTGNK